MLFLEFAPSCNKLSWMFPVSTSAPLPKKWILERNIFTAVSRSDTILIEGEIPMVLTHKNTLNDRRLWLEIGDTVGVRTAHCINSTSPVELQYCLRTKMYIDALVSAECFQGFLAAYFICLETLNGFIV